MAEARAAALLLLAACSKSPPAAHTSTAAPMAEATAQLAGEWSWRGGAELWLPMGDALVGAGLSLRDGEVSGYELLAIRTEHGGRLRYDASPGCARWATFHQRSGAPLSFERAPGDFPATLRYTRAGDGLQVEVRGDGGEGFTMDLRALPATDLTPEGLRLGWAPTARRWQSSAAVDPGAPAWPLPGADAAWRPAPGGALWLVADVEDGAPRVMIVEERGDGGAIIICAARLTPPA